LGQTIQLHSWHGLLRSHIDDQSIGFDDSSLSWHERSTTSS
jgi:hypothetical protein